MLGVIMLIAVMPSVIMLSVVGPSGQPSCHTRKDCTKIEMFAVAKQASLL
jgi:hypothetical protein